MRSLSFMAALILPLTAVSAAPAPPTAAPQPAMRSIQMPAKGECRLPRATFAHDGQVATRVQKLSEQPPANHYLAVDRRVGGCEEPAIVRTGIGG